MVGATGDLFLGLPTEVQAVLAAPPVTEKKLAELTVAYAGLSSSQARMANAVRVFVITWDPLELHAQRPDGFATANAGSLGLELAVYVPIWSLVELASTRYGTIAAALGAMAGSAVVVAAAHADLVISGRYPDQVFRRAVPDLLSDPAAGSALGPPAIRLTEAGWDDIGLGAITDIVQQIYGPVAFDRSPVELAVLTKPQFGCPACAGRRFNFPADLADAAEQRMCQSHRSEAEKVIQRRTGRAGASNPNGWAAMIDASVRLERPHLPNGLANKLIRAEDAMYGAQEQAELANWADYVVEAASWFPGRVSDLAVALGEEPESVVYLPEWLASFIFDLGRAGLGSHVVKVGEALGIVDPDRRSVYYSDVAVALADAGLADEARSWVEANLARWPDDIWVRIHAGDALAALDDVAGAEAYFETAAILAGDAGNFESRSAAFNRLRRIRRGALTGERGRSTVKQTKRKPSRSQRKGKR